MKFILNNIRCKATCHLLTMRKHTGKAAVSNTSELHNRLFQRSGLPLRQLRNYSQQKQKIKAKKQKTKSVLRHRQWHWLQKTQTSRPETLKHPQFISTYVNIMYRDNSGVFAFHFSPKVSATSFYLVKSYVFLKTLVLPKMFGFLHKTMSNFKFN